MELYNLGQRDFGENYVQEIVEKHFILPHDIRWHFIGHLQSNKVKYIAPFIHLIHGVDSLKLLLEIDKQARKNKRVINCLLQVHIAQEETKFGLNEEELDEIILGLEKMHSVGELTNVKVCGLMGMASFSDDEITVRNEFRILRALYHKYLHIQNAVCHFEHLSMGMSSDFKWAVEEGSNMVRIGSAFFGVRPPKSLS
jgi:pyridoxal phosphate enzyme (YggS family)